MNSLTKFTSSSRSTEFKDIFPWNISQMITKTFSIRTRKLISYAMKCSIEFDSKLWKQRQHDDQNFLMEGKAL